jgi:hypothetical protein
MQPIGGTGRSLFVPLLSLALRRPTKKASPTTARSPRVAPTPIPAAAPGLSFPPPLLLAAGSDVDEVLGAVEVEVLVPVDMGV